MPKEEKKTKKTMKLRHNPLGTDLQEKPLKPIKQSRTANMDVDDEVVEDNEKVPDSISSKIMSKTAYHDNLNIDEKKSKIVEINDHVNNTVQYDDAESDIDDNVEDDDDGEDFVEYDGEYVEGLGYTEAEDAIVQKFLEPNRNASRTLADIIIDRIREKEQDSQSVAESQATQTAMPTKVIEVYTMVGKMLQIYKTGKLPKALKMLPHLKNWEEVLWLTRPDLWSSPATYACTRIFASNLNAKMAQRFFNIVLLEKCRDDIRANKKLNYHLYMALKKSLFKPAAFFKGILLPLAQSRTCSLREATIIGSIVAKVSVPGDHSAAALLRLLSFRYSGSTSLFVKILVNKRYALPRRVLDALVDHFTSFENDTRVLPVLWHQSFLVFAQRYKLDLDDNQRARLKSLLRLHVHHSMTPEIRRELFQNANHMDIGNGVS